MAIITAPIITFPTTELGYSTNLIHQTLMGTVDTAATSLIVNGTSGNVSYTPHASSWSFNTDLVTGLNVFNVMASDGVSISTPATLNVSYTTEDNLNLIVSSPTAISIERGINTVKISVVINPESSVIGYNFYASESVGGGTNGYTLLNKTLITAYDYSKEDTQLLSSTASNSASGIRTTTTVEKITKNKYFTFLHDRVNNAIGTLPLSEPNHYVVTAVAYDPTNKQQIESMYSSELPGIPLILDANVKEIELRTTLDVQQSYISSVLESDPDIDVKPGTVTRDVHINPPSDEFARLYVIRDFMHKSQSFVTLIPFDDANGDGISDDVLTSTDKLKLKESLLITDANAYQVQQIIDGAFDKLAGNVNVSRKGAQKSLGQAQFYTRKEPTKDVTVSVGAILQTTSDQNTQPIQFTVLTDFVMFLSSKDQYYNKVTKKYEFTLDIQAQVAGAAGDVDAYKINSIVSGADNILGVQNINPTDFGQDAESNNDLAKRALLAFVGVDSGTEGGYLSTTLNTPGISKCRIISAGEPYMQRDLDPLRLIHTYGKVDIYIQGSTLVTKTETFGFTYATVPKEKVEITSALHFHFKSLNPNISAVKRIYQILEVHNNTKSSIYNIDNYKITGDGDIIELDETLPENISIGLSPTDIITVSYRYRDSDPYVFLSQPVDSIISVTGEKSGKLDPINYILYKSEDPLTIGNSTASENNMKLIYSDTNNLPQGDVIKVFDETVVLFGDSVPLSRLDISKDTIVVTDTTQTVTYLLNIDYSIYVSGMNTTITRISSGNIAYGQTVLVDYDAGENFTVVYTTNSLLSTVQNKVNTMKHLTADVIVKGSVVTALDMDLHIYIYEGSDQTSLDIKIRTAIAKLLQDKNIGESIYQSDIVYAIEGIPGVDYVSIPFKKMVKANGSIILRELYTGGWNVHQTVNVTSFESTKNLNWATVENGAPTGLYSGVYENDYALELVGDINSVSLSSGRAYISSSGQLFVSPKFSTSPLNSKISVTYVVENAQGAGDITVSDLEYGKVGQLNTTLSFTKKFKGF